MINPANNDSSFNAGSNAFKDDSFLNPGGLGLQGDAQVPLPSPGA